MNSIPEDLENMILKYKKQFEKIDIHNLKKRRDELEEEISRYNRQTFDRERQDVNYIVHSIHVAYKDDGVKRILKFFEDKIIDMQNLINCNRPNEYFIKMRLKEYDKVSGLLLKYEYLI